MKYNGFESFKEWFGYSRRERRSSFILLILILVIASARFIIPGKDTSIEKLILQNEEDGNDFPARKDTSPVKIIRDEAWNYRREEPLLKLNECDSTALEALPGIGPVLAARIIKYRNLLGGYAAVGQLRNVYGLSEETYNLISNRFSADSSGIKKIKINSADYRQMIRFPYFEKQEVSAIIKYRERNGRIKNLEDLIVNNIITSEKAGDVRPYLEFTE